MEDIKSDKWVNPQSLAPFEFQLADSFSLQPRIRAKLLEFGYTEQEINEYENEKSLSPIKTAHYLLQEAFTPRTLPKYNLNVQPSRYSFTRPLKPPKQKQTLLNRIKQEIVEKIEPYSPAGRPPVCVTVEHESSLKNTHSRILKNVIQQGGKIINFNEDVVNEMSASIPFKTADPFVKDEELPIDYIDIRIVTRRCGLHWQSTFYLLNKYDSQAIFEEFDDIVMTLLQ